MVSRTISIDSTDHKTKLCKLGGILNTDKSPYATDGTGGHRKGYTAVYELLFGPLKYEEINFLEIGIEKGASTFLWEQYFESAKLYAFEHDEGKIDRVKQLADKTSFHKVDSGNKEQLEEVFKSTGVLFDIILEDASHQLEHQRNAIEIGVKYLKPGGILVIEDLNVNDAEDIFDEVIANHFAFNTFIKCEHSNKKAENNDKLWVGIKR
jgi:precorrin-6B methylase 2